MPSDAVRSWLDKAAEDETVFALIRSAEGPWSQAAYHLQQAAEKLVKAALLSTGVAPPKSHDLVHLLGLFPELTIPKAVEDGAMTLSTFAWITRYPGSSRIERAHVEEAERHFREVEAWSLTIIEEDRPSV